MDSVRERRLTVLDLIVIVAIASIYSAALGSLLRNAFGGMWPQDKLTRGPIMLATIAAPFVTWITWYLSRIMLPKGTTKLRPWAFAVYLLTIMVSILSLLLIFDVQPLTGGLLACAWPATLVYLATW
jgi:cation transporter-like permease